MKHTRYKLFTIGEHEKEEAWLNEMAAKGMMLSQVGVPKYVFEEDTPGKYIYRLELLDHPPAHPESVAYIQFLEETGIEVVGSYLRWVYFRRPAHEGAFELYSDIDSIIRHYKRITTLANVLSYMMTVVCFVIWLAWFQQNDSVRDANLIVLLLAWFCTIFALLIQTFVLPVRRSLRRLKKERRFRE